MIGIDRPVRLVVVPSVHFVDVNVSTALVAASSGALAYHLSTTNLSAAVSVALLDANGAPVANGSGLVGSLSISNVHLWLDHRFCFFFFPNAYQ